MKMILLIIAVFSANVMAGVEVPSPSGTLVEEVLAQTPSDPHRYDWRNDSLTLEAGYGNVAEYNSFRSEAYHVGFFTPTGGGWIFRGAARRVLTYNTDSSSKMALTPYSQSAQPSRYEFVLGMGYALLDGRSQTALSPRITDVNHALYALVGLQYNYFTSRDEEPLPAMHAVYYNVVAETGLRWQIFFPHSLGLGFEWTYSFPFSGREPDLGSWQRFSGILSWSFASSP